MYWEHQRSSKLEEANIGPSWKPLEGVHLELASETDSRLPASRAGREYISAIFKSANLLQKPQETKAGTLKSFF